MELPSAQGLPVLSISKLVAQPWAGLQAAREEQHGHEGSRREKTLVHSWEIGIYMEEIQGNSTAQESGHHDSLGS